jgi:hypothetical protein
VISSFATVLAMSQIEVALYETAPGKKVRVVLDHSGGLRPVFWFKVSTDGSIYLGPRLKTVTSMRAGAKHTEQGVLTVLYEEGEEIKDPSLLKGKISFHSSGTIYSAGEQLFRDSIRSISKQEELCRVLFANPCTFDAIEGHPRKLDVCLRYPSDKRCPLQAVCFIAPQKANHVVRIKDAAHQMNLFFPFSGLKGVPDIMLQLILFHASEMPWPPYTYLFFGTVGAKMESASPIPRT